MSPAAGRAAARPGRSRDPVARRAAIVAAALEVVAEVGVGRTTHRAIAARAGVPLGSTTYYFPTLDDLVAAALEAAASATRDLLAGWADQLAADRDLPRVLTDLVAVYLSDRPRALLECELYLAAARSPALRPLADVWLDGARDLLADHVGADRAAAVVALVDGVMLAGVVRGGPVDRAALEAALSRLCR